jgi:hypothetical protein
MAEYDIAFAEKLAEVAGLFVAHGLTDDEAKRTVLYLSLLSTEISLKSMLERAGESVTEIRTRSHRLADLLTDLGQYEVEIELTPGKCMCVPASRFRFSTFKHGGVEVTIGTVMEVESRGGSTYPIKVKHDDVLRHFPSEVMAQMAATVAAFAREHWQNIRVK